MANETKVRDSIKNFLLKMKTMHDAIPEELTEDALEMSEEVNDALCEEVVEETTDEEKEETIEEIVERVVGKALKDAGVIKEEVKEFDELEAELEKTGDGEIEGEESITVAPEEIHDEEIKEIISDVKPAIAAIKDAAAKKKIVDSFVKLARMNYGTTKEYSDIMKAVNGVKNARAKDAAKHNDDYSFGMDIAKKYNPHFKEVK